MGRKDGQRWLHSGTIQTIVPLGAVQSQDVLGTQLGRKFVLLLLDEVNEAEEEGKLDLMARIIWVSVF